MTTEKVGDHTELSGEDARSGRTGMHLRYILMASMALVIVGFSIIAVLN